MCCVLSKATRFCISRVRYVTEFSNVTPNSSSHSYTVCNGIMPFRRVRRNAANTSRGISCSTAQYNFLQHSSIQLTLHRPAFIPETLNKSQALPVIHLLAKCRGTLFLDNEVLKWTVHREGVLDLWWGGGCPLLIRLLPSSKELHWGTPALATPKVEQQSFFFRDTNGRLE